MGHARWFQRVHGHHLVYVTSFEDPAVDREALKPSIEDRVATITSGGCNALDLVLAGAGEVHAVDVNPLQSAMLELRVAAIRSLEYADFFALFGSGFTPHARGIYFEALRPVLGGPARKFWDGHWDWFAGLGWRNRFIYRGSAGFVHKVIRDYAIRVCGLGGAIEELLSAPDAASQREIFLRHDMRRRIGGVFFRRLLGHPFCLSLLGIPESQRAEIDSHPDGVSGYALDALERALTQTPLRENYFWRGVIEGGYVPECCPEFLKPAQFARLKGGLVDRLFIHTGTMTDFLNASPAPITKLLLLDHMDWMSAADPEGLAAEWSAILNRCRGGARVVFRSAARNVRYLDPLRVKFGGGEIRLADAIEPRTDLARELFARERTGIYGSYHVVDIRTHP